MLVKKLKYKDPALPMKNTRAVNSPAQQSKFNIFLEN